MQKVSKSMEKEHFGLAGGGSVAGMSAAVRFGDMIAVSGQVAMTADGKLVGHGDIDAQIEQCFTNLADVLGRAGAGLADVVSLTTYLTSAEFAPRFLAARQRYFPERAPATTTVIASLLHPEFLIEIQALAAL